MNALLVRELTARGRGGVSVLEVSGEGARAFVERFTGDVPVRAGEARVRRLLVDGELLDEALIWAESDARVELHLHGAPPLVRRVVAHWTARREVASDAAESALEDRARTRLAAAASDAAARVLLDQAEGALRRELEAIVTGLRASDRDVAARIRALAEAGERARYLFEPPVVVLAGPVNAGKSTLFNVLVGRERVVVDPERGTTRDAIRERVRLGAYAVDLVDTAGERDLGADAAARVEHAGQLLGRSLRASADLVLRLEPDAAPAEVADAGALLAAVAGAGLERTIVSRADERPQDVPGRPTVSHLDPDGMRRVVVEVVHEALALDRVPWIAGAPVPFERELLSALRRAAADDRGIHADELESWLAR